ncbi:hypothetical protein GOBAR_AA09062 [Gossypium barbadense]|uniref:Uncharacterized protein n=1 Tax=Gossypium barbadense TaxID=3634 RepID=A0A2P5Y7P2_GOSBA|nr:hypothetical protein GOBAR_AA09062 [Gossypium barbadense]
MSSSRGKKATVPASKKRKGASSSSSPTAKVCHPFLRFPTEPQEELFQILWARPLIAGRCIDWAIMEQVQLAEAIRALLSTDPWELFFGIIEPTYLKITIELCSTFHLQTVMMNYDDPDTEFKEENDLHALNHHIHRSPSRCWDELDGERALVSSTLMTPTFYGVCHTGTSLTLPISSPSQFGTRRSGVGRGSSLLAHMLLGWLDTSGSSTPQLKNHP